MSNKNFREIKRPLGSLKIKRGGIKNERKIFWRKKEFILGMYMQSTTYMNKLSELVGLE